MTPCGDSPVPGDTWIRVTFRNGKVEELYAWAVDWWDNRGDPEDVVDWEYADCPNRTVSDSRTAHLEG